jgi:hypothetical protein
MDSRREAVRGIYFIAALVSIVLAFDGSWRASVINPDGICYLQSAATLASAGLHDAMQICGQAKWPFYSMLIFGVVSVTKLSYISAAFFLNGLLSLVSVLTFIYITHLLGANRRVMWFAAATILLMHEFNSVREYVIRDHGFWAAYLVAIAGLIHYFRAPSWRYALLWSAATIVATLFRVEGILFLLLMPFTAFFAGQNRVEKFLQLNCLTLIIAASLSLLALASHSALHANRLGEIEFQFAHGVAALVRDFHIHSAALGQYVLNGYSARDASWILALMLIAWYVASFVINLSFVYTGLALFAMWRKLLPLDRAALLVVLGYFAVNVLITAPFLVEYMFLSKRYLLGMSLLFMLWVPFTLDYLQRHVATRKVIFPAVILLMVLTALGGIFDFGYSKTYVRKAGEWLADNLPANANLYSNDLQVLFYSRHFGSDIFAKANAYADSNALADEKWRQYDYLALQVSRKNLAALQQIHLIPYKIFANKRGDEVVIYKRQA